MLRIQPLILEMARDVREYTDQISCNDRDLARQLRRSSMSVVLNTAEGYSSTGGTKRARYETALGSLRETLAGLQGAEALGYVPQLRPATLGRFDQLGGALYKLANRQP